MIGIILAGGESRRMGRDKVFLDAAGVPLFERVHGVLRQIFRDIIVVSNNPRWFHAYGVRVIPDLIPGQGALGGLYTGLKHASNDRAFCFAADMPFLNPRLIRYMMERGYEGDVIIPKTSDGLQPLHAIYSQACLKPIEDLISRGNLKIVDFFRYVTVVYISESEILTHDPKMISFLNINTKEDLRQVEHLLTQSLGVDS